MNRSALLIICFSLCLAILTSCSPKSSDVLKIGMNVEFPPFGYKADSTYVGVDVDLAGKIAEKMDMPYEIIDMEFDTLIHALLSEQVDIVISAMSITAQRSRQVEFSRPYYLAHQVLIYSDKSPKMPDTEDELGKYRLGVLHGSTAHNYIIQTLVDRDLMSMDDLLVYVSNTEAIEDLVAGKLDFIVNDNSAAYGFSRLYPVKIGMKLNTVEEYAIAMPRDGKNNERVNKALQDIIDSGEMASIIANHIE